MRNTEFKLEGNIFIDYFRFDTPSNKQMKDVQEIQDMAISTALEFKL
jgi:hypothetical protein